GGTLHNWGLPRTKPQNAKLRSLIKFPVPTHDMAVDEVTRKFQRNR
ncbi:proteophosphoglycan ppg4, partial [Moniliophthora roreri]